MTTCPFCTTGLITDLIADFFYCHNCGVAVRAEKDMPEWKCNKDWLESEKAGPVIFRKAQHIAREIAKEFYPCKVLDVGCGSGQLTVALRELEFETDGLDSSVEVIKYLMHNHGGKFYFDTADMCLVIYRRIHNEHEM